MGLEVVTFGDISMHIVRREGVALFALRELDDNVIRLVPTFPKHKSEASIRSEIRGTMLLLKLNSTKATKPEIRLMKEDGVVGKRAPKATLLYGADVVKLLTHYNATSTATHVQKFVNGQNGVGAKKGSEGGEKVTQEKPTKRPREGEDETPAKKPKAVSPSVPSPTQVPTPVKKEVPTASSTPALSLAAALDVAVAAAITAITASTDVADVPQTQGTRVKLAAAEPAKIETPAKVAEPEQLQAKLETPVKTEPAQMKVEPPAKETEAEQLK